MPHSIGRAARITGWVGVLLIGPALGLAQGQVVVAGTIGLPERDLTPEQEQNLLAEYWTVAKRYRLEPVLAITEMTAWTRDRIGKVQSIQYQPESTARPAYLEGRAEWNPATLRLAAMLHSDVGLEAFRKGNIQEFEFQAYIADGWLALADNRQSAVGSLRSRWNVTVARLLLASGEVGRAEQVLARLNARISGDPAILLAFGTVRETLASRQLAAFGGGQLDEPALAKRPWAAAVESAASFFEKAIAIDANMVEAKVRLAHIYLMKGDDARAEGLLVQALAGEAPPSVKYVATMFLGGIRERRQQLDSAARAYLEAILALPDGQSGYLALAHVFGLAGQRAEAAAVLDRMFGRSAANLAADPWRTYPLGFVLDARFEEYRVEARK